MSDELKHTGSLMIDSPTNMTSFVDDGSEISYSYYPYVLAELIYNGDVTGYVDQGELIIRPFQTVLEEPVITSDGNLMFVRG